MIPAPYIDNPAANYPEDAAHENGKYLCRCIICCELFIGHKRRIVCKLCNNPPAPPTAATSPSANAEVAK